MRELTSVTTWMLSYEVILKAQSSSDDFLKNLLKRYRITNIDKRSCKLVSRRTNMTWKIEILPTSTLKA